jgi:hypothetical protein
MSGKVVLKSYHSAICVLMFDQKMLSILLQSNPKVSNYHYSQSSRLKIPSELSDTNEA